MCVLWSIDFLFSWLPQPPGFASFSRPQGEFSNTASLPSLYHLSVWKTCSFSVDFSHPLLSLFLMSTLSFRILCPRMHSLGLTVLVHHSGEEGTGGRWSGGGEGLMAVGATCSACSHRGRLRSRKLGLELRRRTLKACSYIWPPGVYAPKVPQVPQTVPVAGDQYIST